MKRAVKISLSLAGGLCVVGIALWLAGFFMGGRAEVNRYYADRWNTFPWQSLFGPIRVNTEGVHIGGENGIHVDSDGVSIGGEHGIQVGHHSESGHSGRKQQLETGALTGVTSVEVDVDCGDVWVQEGDEVSASLSWNLNNYDLSYHVENGVLKVESESWGIGHIGTLNINCKVIVTVPAGTALDELEISTDLGDVEVDADVTVRKAELSTNLGDVVCRNLQARELDAESDLGDITVAVPAECKDLSYDLSTDLGTVYFNGQSQKNPTVKVSSDQKYYVEAKTSLGNVKLEYMG